MPGDDSKTLEQLLDGMLPWSETHRIMASFKDPDRFGKMLAIYQERVPWNERILMPYGENLFIVECADGAQVTKCVCGHDFGDYHENWKLSALIFVRDTADKMDEIYPKMMAADPDWMELREYYCPGCKRQLEVEALPPGYPIQHEFQPDLETFYEQWLGASLRGESRS